MLAMESDFFALPVPRLIAHRGGGSSIRPENTLDAFIAATALGVHYLELDIHATRDGVIVVAHDPDLRRNCGRDGLIAALDAKELAAADAGFTFTVDGKTFPFRGRGLRIPTLAEVFAACPQQRYIVEVKQTAPSVVPGMLAVIDRFGMARRILIASEHQAPLDELRALRPELPTSFSGYEIAGFVAAMNSAMSDYRPPAPALQVPPRFGTVELATPAMVAAAHRVGIELHVWTINQEPEMRAMLAMGVDGILTDFPNLLMRMTGNQPQNAS
jgi:glycerophosphoryl diester phosphodiesterase